MAQLAKRPAPGDWNLGTEFDFSAQDKSFAILRERADAITKDQVKAGQIQGGIIQFGVADGYAFYLVAKTTPLTLQHIPYGDAWSVSAAMIRGLRITDIQEMMLRDILARELFSHKKQ